MSPVFSPTPSELAVVSQIFSQADPQKTGVLTGDVAVRVFGGAKLPATTLGTIWNISDEDDKGWLPKRGVAIAVRLIGWAQKGEKITKDLVKKPGPLAVIEGINTVSQQNTGMSLPRSPPPTPYPPLTAQEKAKFHSMFMKNNPVNSLLSGEKAHDIFVKSKLSKEQLMKIWNLADTQGRGALDSTDFAIGMYFIQGVMSNKISFIPTLLPPGLYHQASGGQEPFGPVKSHISGNSGSFSPVGGSFQQHMGQNQILQPDITGLSSQLKAPTVSAHSFTHSNGYAPAWDVSPTEKASSDRLFDTLDSQKRGYIEGEVAVPFMLESKLPGEVLAQIWDLADINSDGRLTRDGFAIALHLIQKKLAGQDVPSNLPPSLMPPSARVSAFGTSPFSPVNAQSHQEPESATDLFSFDDTPPSSALSQQPPNNFSGVLKEPTGSTSNAFASSKPNVDTDVLFSYQTSPPQDLLSDDDTHGTVSPPLHDQSAEIGNLKNQFQSTKRSLTAAGEERLTLELTLADQASQLSSIQTQLSSAKAAYETETNLLATFKERHSAQVADIQNTRKELIGAESDLSAIRVEKAEIEGAFLRDKEEARELHKRMIETGKQAEALKSDVERLKKEAKQQKGLLAIARKQLSSKESEKTKAEREHAESVEELSSITRDKDTVDAELAIMSSPEPKVAQRTLSSDSLSFAASQPIPMTPDLSVLPQLKSNNPFERLAMSSPLLQRSPSPFSIQGSAPPSLSSLTEPTSSSPSTSNEVSLELPEPDLLAASSTFNSFSAVQIPASPNSSQPSGDLHLKSVLSPATVNDTDYFVTPPTSAEHDSDASLTRPKERFPSLDKLSDSIPTIATDSLSLKHLSAADVDANLVAQSKELEKSDDSDSDSNDEMPLTVLAANISKQPTKSIPPSQGIDTNGSAASAPTSVFDDIFGPDNADEVQTHLPTTGNPMPSNVSIVPSEQTEDIIHTSTQASNVAGVNEFDETMGKMPASATPANFSFDPRFEDNFDFASASKTFEEPKIEIQDLKKTTHKVEFDDIFKDDDVPKTTGPSTPFYLPPTDKDRTSGAFDAVFAGFESSPVLKLEDEPIGDSPPALSRSDEPSIPGSFPQPPSLTTPPAQAIITTPRDSDSKPMPPRERSPPPLRSPKPRSSSSSSSKDNNDKPKEPQARHSKLSIRLFGKRKKQQEPILPSATQHLTPPIEEPRRMSTPLGDEDVEPVKQLTAMGFSRTQAVDALERNGYDFRKALNNLLGTP